MASPQPKALVNIWDLVVMKKPIREGGTLK